MAKKDNALSNKQRLALIFAFAAVLVVGTLSLLESMSLDYYSVMGTLGKIVPASLTMGAIGWIMGFILDQPRRGHQIGYSKTFINDMIKSESKIDNIDESDLDDVANEELKSLG